MTTLYGVNYTKYNTGPTQDNIVGRGVNGGNVKCLIDTYETAATSAADVVYMAKPLIAGDIVIGFFLSSDNVGATGTVDIGTLYNDDEFASAIDVSGQVVNGNTSILVDGMGYVIGTSTNDEIITLTLNTAAMTGTIKLVLLYIGS